MWTIEKVRIWQVAMKHLGMPPAQDALDSLIQEYVDMRETVAWIAAQTDLFFAECSQAEEIVARCKKVLNGPPDKVGV